MTDLKLVESSDVLHWQDRWLTLPGGPADDAPAPDGPPWAWIATNHRCNARLWAQEDLARRQQAPDAEIVANKRAIDGFNQARNDAIERIDEALLMALGWLETRAGELVQRPAPAGARLNSETPGSMIDRLSILALKQHAMAAQAERQDVDEGHRETSRSRLARLTEQRADLAACLDDLLRDARAGRAWFKVYRQFKMYNDPRFNPALVAEQKRSAGRPSD
ncbi:MAG: DUF4254 domain-containing protein [Rubrivivax sp.]|nr:DUF4254 domain-containing protein [Rubrivivax sp.]